MKNIYKILHVSQFSKVAIVAGIFGITGVTLLLATKATTTGASFEAESGSKSSNIATFTDSAASGGSAIKFSAASSAPTQTNCAPTPSTCGYPDASNTGPAAGTIFKRVPQDVTSGQGWAYDSGSDVIVVDWQSDGAVIDGITTTKPILIDGKNATIKNSVIAVCNIGDQDIIAIRAGNPGNGYAGDHPTIINNRLSGCPGSQITQDQPGRPRSDIRDIYGAAKQAVITGNDMSGAGNCITIESEGYIADNWCHDLGHNPNTSAGAGMGDHHSGFSNHGGAAGTNWTYNGQTHKGVEYVHNTALLNNTRSTNDGGLSGAITVYGDFARAQNVTIDGNLVSGGAYTMYGGINNESTYGQPLNVSLINNRFACGQWVYGPLFVRASTIVTGNYCDANLSAVN
jgi:hypothetical protein